MGIEPAEIFKVLSVDTRIKIVELLKKNGPTGVKEISEKLHLTAPAVSQHLKILKHAGMVSCERQGYWIPYAINEGAMEKYRKILDEVCTCGCQHNDVLEKQELSKTGLHALKSYEKKLLNELKTVRQRIKEVEAKA